MPARRRPNAVVSDRRLFPSGVFSCEGGDAAQLCPAWRPPPPGACLPPWSLADGGQQDGAAAAAHSAAPTDVYMQTLCPSYTMLTYTHTPLLTNFGVRIGGRCPDLRPLTFDLGKPAAV